MAVLALEQFPYSWVEIHTTFGRVRCSHQSSRTNTCSIRQNFKESLPFLYDVVVKLCIELFALMHPYTWKLWCQECQKWKRNIYDTRENNSAPSVSHAHAECMRKKKKKRGKEEDHLIFKDHVIVYTDEMARLSMLRQS